MNGAVIRRMVGHERFSGLVAGQALAQLLATVRLHDSAPLCELLSALLQTAGADPRGGQSEEVISPVGHITPCDRLLTHAGVAEAVKTALRTQRDQLELHRIRQEQEMRLVSK